MASADAPGRARPAAASLLAAATLLLVSLISAASPSKAQISPGKLSAVHEQLEGSRNCLQCHSREEGVDADRCLSCHQVLEARIEAGRGLHANPGFQECRTCHIEHHGREYELIWWGPEGRDAFDHARAGWPLEGAHGSLECQTCHRPENIADADALRAVGRSLEKTLLGLSASCASCHEDEHRGQFEGRVCSSCHGMDSFAGADSFDHSGAAFALTGAHTRVECDRCHAVEETAGGPVTRFRPVEHAQCAACHSDPHRGGLGPSCSDCHSTDSWQSTPGFDHARTRFPLTGRHRQVGCAECHGAAAATSGGDPQRFRGVVFAACSDCHGDPHEGRLGAACADCHDTRGWNRVAADRFDHAQTDFPLDGAHATVDCESCHRPGQPLRIPGAERCETCHEDEHLGQFRRRADGGSCASCHTVEGFVPSLFELADHQQTGFALEGRHQAVACADCHRETTFRSNAGALASTRRFQFEDLSCESCHEDPHDGTARVAERGCASCHGNDGWELLTFDHGSTRFPLEGMHAEAACLDCHLETRGPRPAGSADLRLALSVDPACESCHDDPHDGQFAGREAGCASCHRSDGWGEVSFDHAVTRFPLTGAHGRAECAACHAESSSGARRFAGTPIACEACHSG